MTAHTTESTFGATQTLHLTCETQGHRLRPAGPARLQLNSAKQRMENNVSSSTNTDELTKQHLFTSCYQWHYLSLRAEHTFVFLNLYGLPRPDREKPSFQGKYAVMISARNMFGTDNECNAQLQQENNSNNNYTKLLRLALSACTCCCSGCPAHTWDALNDSSCSRSMFTLALVNSAPRDVLIKDEATALEPPQRFSCHCAFLSPTMCCTTHCKANTNKSSCETLDRG